MRIEQVSRVALAAVLAAGVAVGLAAPGHADPSDPADVVAQQREELFTTAVRQGGFRISANEAVSLGQSTCDVLKRSGSTQDALYHVKNATEWTNLKLVSNFASLAVQAYCPTAMPR